MRIRIHRRYRIAAAAVFVVAAVSVSIVARQGGGHDQAQPAGTLPAPTAAATASASPSASDALSTASPSAGALPYRDASLPVEQRVDDLLGRMTLDEKIAQMVQPDREHASADDFKEFGIGSLLSGGGSSPQTNSPEAWFDMADTYAKAATESRLGVPLLHGIDAVHGNNNVVGATLFPHNIGLGAAGDPELVRRIGEATAQEVRATGIPWDFAPCLCAPQDARWGRTYEGYSENPDLVAKLGAAYVTGLQGAPGSDGWLQGEHAIATLKHFVGDGATEGGVDRGDAKLTAIQLERFIQPYQAGIQAGAQAVMVSFSSRNGDKMHGNRALITDELKGKLGFKGIVISDYEGIENMDPNYQEAVEKGVNAGIDIFMEPNNWKLFLETLKSLVQDGKVPQSRIDDAARRILRVKFEAGLFEHPVGDRRLLQDGDVGSGEHRALAREAVAKSLVLLKNDDNLLPLRKNIANLFVAGALADDIGGQSGGWSISWQGQLGDTTPGTTLLEGIKQAVSAQTTVTFNPDGKGAEGADAAIVVVGETPYAEGAGDSQDLHLSPDDRALIDRVTETGVPTVVLLLSGRPMIVTDEMKKANAFVAAWLPGTEGEGVSDALFGDKPFTGKLSYTWPRSMDQMPIHSGDSTRNKAGDPLFPYGYGLTTKAR